MKIENIPAGPQLDALVAMAQWWELIQLTSSSGWMLHPSDYEGIYKWFTEDGEKPPINKEDYTPSTTPAQWAELIEAFDVSVWVAYDDKTEAKLFGAQTESGRGVYSRAGYGEAICKAVIAAKWGDVIPDDVWEKVK